MENQEANKKRPAVDDLEPPAVGLEHEHAVVNPVETTAASSTTAPTVTAGAAGQGAALVSAVQAATAELVAQASVTPDAISSVGQQPVAKPKGAPRGRYVIVDPNRPKKAKVPRGPSDNNTGSSLKSGGTCTACAGSKVCARRDAYLLGLPLAFLPYHFFSCEACSSLRLLSEHVRSMCFHTSNSLLNCVAR